MLSARRLLAVLSIILVAQGVAAADRAGFLTSYCVDCHGADVVKGGFRADRLPTSLADPAALAEWVRVYDKVARGEMPPHKAEQPTEADRKPFLASLKSDLLAAEQKQAVKGLHTTMRRMNRVEYENTLRDLLALPNLHVKESLPEDGQQHGFDKVGGALDLSPIHVSKYLDAAEKALRQAIVRDRSAPETRTWREPAVKQHSVNAALAIHCAVPLKGRELAAGLTTHIVGNPVKDIGNTYRAATFRGEADSVRNPHRCHRRSSTGRHPDRSLSADDAGLVPRAVLDLGAAMGTHEGRRGGAEHGPSLHRLR